MIIGKKDEAIPLKLNEKKKEDFEIFRYLVVRIHERGEPEAENYG